MRDAEKIQVFQGAEARRAGKFIMAAVLRALDQELIELEPWDPMGSLAD